AEDIPRHVSGMSVRILIDDFLKLFLSCQGTLFQGSKTGEVRFGGNACGAKRRVHSACRLAEQDAGFLVLLVEVEPCAECRSNHEQYGDRGDNQGFLVLDTPMDRASSGVNGDTAEAILFQ